MRRTLGLVLVGLFGVQNAGLYAPAGFSTPPPPPPPHPLRACAPGAACCPTALKNPPCRVGCPGPAPRRITHVAPDLRSVARPYPSGVVILELGIDEQGHVVSACVLRGVRSDFDTAAQAAARHWRFTAKILNDKPIGVVMTVTVSTPDRAAGR